MRTVPLRQTITMVIGFLILSVALIVMDRQSLLDPVRNGLSEVMSPVQSGIGELLDSSRNESDLEKDLARVTAERDALLAENANLRADTQELAALRELQQVEDDNPGFSYTPARVIGRDPTGISYSVTIDKGTEDGLALGMAVVNPSIYVGQITAIEANEAVVTFIIDTSMRVGAKGSVSGGDGVVYGQWNVGGRLVLRNVDLAFPPESGETIVTADTSTVQTRQVPPGIPIGFVAGEPIQNDQTDEFEVEIVPFISDFDDLQILYVVTQDE